MLDSVIELDCDDMNSHSLLIPHLLKTFQVQQEKLAKVLQDLIEKTLKSIREQSHVFARILHSYEEKQFLLSFVRFFVEVYQLLCEWAEELNVDGEASSDQIVRLLLQFATNPEKNI